MARMVAALVLLIGCGRACAAAPSAATSALRDLPEGFTVEAMPAAGDFLAARESSLSAQGPQFRAAGLGAERAQILLRSLTVPGWGQATLGLHTSAKVFALAEAAVWTSFIAFRVQGALRRQSSEVEARLFAGIDLQGRDEEFRRIVGIYPSSDDYNLYVVRRDAANLYYGPEALIRDDPVLYRQYIADHEIKGSDSWAWDSADSYLEYRDLRKFTQRAGLRANAMLGLAIANRLLSAVHAARHAGATPEQHSWNLECGPRPGDPAAMALGVRVRF